MERVIAKEPNITRFDILVGDDDCGICLKRGANAVLDYIGGAISEDAVRLVSDISQLVETTMDGTSGAIYAIFLNALTQGLANQHVASDTVVNVDASIWSKALSSALDALGNYTPAQPGHRTLIDALSPFVETMDRTKNLAESVAAAEEGANATIAMEASLGRTVYIGGGAFKSCPDPGAYALGELLLGLSCGYEEIFS